MKKTMWDLKEERLEQRLQALAQQGESDGVVQALEDYDNTKDPRHEDRKLYEEDDRLDIILSQEAEDLPNLVAEYPSAGPCGS